jgi:hypothetical protein
MESLDSQILESRDVVSNGLWPFSTKIASLDYIRNIFSGFLYVILGK